MLRQGKVEWFLPSASLTTDALGFEAAASAALAANDPAACAAAAARYGGDLLPTALYEEWTSSCCGPAASGNSWWSSNRPTKLPVASLCGPRSDKVSLERRSDGTGDCAPVFTPSSGCCRAAGVLRVLVIAVAHVLSGAVKRRGGLASPQEETQREVGGIAVHLATLLSVRLFHYQTPHVASLLPHQVMMRR